MAGFYRAPQLRLVDSDKERHATWLELFFDLVFVVAITQLGTRLSAHLDFINTIQFIFLFIPVWWAWVGHTVFATRFDTDDGVHRLVTFIMMYAAAIMAVQIPSALEQGANGFALGFIIARLGLLFLYFRAHIHLPTIKQITTLYLLGFGLGVICWILSLFINAPSKFIFWMLGLGIEFITPWIGKKNILIKAPLDTSHIPERFGLFTIIVLGETVFAVILGITHAHWQWLAIIISVLAFILAIIIWWSYYTYMQMTDYKCSLNSGQPFIYTHLLLMVSLVVIGVCVEHIIAGTALLKPFSEFNFIFCGAILLWIGGFLLLQHISMWWFNLKKMDITYLLGSLLIVGLFFTYPLSRLYTITVLTLLFFIFLAVQLTLKRQQTH